MSSIQAGLSFHRYNGDGAEWRKGPRSCPAGAPPAAGRSALAGPAGGGRHRYAISRPSHAERHGRLSRQHARAGNHVVKWNCQTWSHFVRREHSSLYAWWFVYTLCCGCSRRIGLYRNTMALARWAISVVEVNAELVYFAMSAEGLFAVPSRGYLMY